jgi:EmrB/QacA subfamily drug resistance transporter
MTGESATITLPQTAAVNGDQWPLRRSLPGLLAICAMAALDQTVVSTALPRIASELGRPAQLGTVIVAYMLASTATAPLCGRISDLWGRKQVLAGALFIFLVGSALCGLAGSLLSLVVFRVVQGLGAGGLIPVVQATLADQLPPLERRRLQGWFSSIFGLCSIVGPCVGGVLTQWLSWRWVFYFNLPLGVLTLPVVLFGLPPRAHRVSPRIDFRGAALLALGAAAALLALDWPDANTRLPGSAVSAVTALLAVYLLVSHERRTEDAFLPVFLYRTASFRRLQVLIALTSLALFTAAVFLPLYLQLIRGAPPMQAGLMMSPLMLGVVAASMGSGRVVFRTGRWKPVAVVGLTATACSLAGLGLAILTAAPAPLLLGLLALLGLGFGSTLPNLMTAVQDIVPVDAMGAAISLTVLARAIGGVTGVTLSGAVLGLWVKDLTSSGSAAAATQFTPPIAAAYQLGLGCAFLTGAALALVAMGVLAAMPGWSLAGAGHPSDARVATHR